MSTKIYNGYRLVKGADVWDVTDRLRREGNVVRDRIDQTLLESIARKKISDEGGDSGADLTQHQLTQAMFAWEKVQQEIGEAYRGHDPFRLEATFQRDPKTGRVLAILYCEHKEMRAVWDAVPEIEEYGYWNNTDPVDGVSRKQWKKREATWRRVLGDDFEPPARRMLSFRLRTGPADGMIEMIYREKK